MARVKVPVPKQPVAPTETVKPTEVVAAPAQVSVPTPVAEAKPQADKPKKPLTWVLVGCLLLVLVGLVMLWNDRNNLQKQVKDLSSSSSTTASKAEVTKITNEIAKYFELPNETPTLATVSDVAAAKQQSPVFFAKAKDGDKVLIYAKAKEAILYRPSTKKIIVVAPLNVTNNSGDSASTVAQ